MNKIDIFNIYYTLSCTVGILFVMTAQYYKVMDKLDKPRVEVQCWTKTFKHAETTWHPIVCPFKGE